MHSHVENLRARHLSCVAALALIAASAAGCSSDVARFNNNPNASPYAEAGPPAAPPARDVTGSLAPGRVESQPLPPPGPAIGPQARTAGGGGITNYNPRPAPPIHDVTGTVAPPPAMPPPSSQTAWTTQGGTAITVGPGETIEHLSQRYGVPASAIMQANNLRAGQHVQPGQRLTIPRYNLVQAPPPARLASNPPPATIGPRGPAVLPGAQHVVASKETLSSIAKRYGKTRVALAQANHLAPDAKLKIGQRLTIPGLAPPLKVKTATAAPPALLAPSAPPAKAPPLKAPPLLTPTAAKAPAVPPPAAKAPTVPPQRVATTDPAATARLATPADNPLANPEPPVDPTGATPSFRWPLHGQVITGFGAKVNGQPNDGINLAVPEGASIKSADDGVVAYAGNELKGYGNLVLVRHGGGFVTAYAHASEVLVKRGDHVKRGQIIARAGQTGNVTSPQLHFEIRKGSTPVDPTQYLKNPTAER